ncbi:hypothetical protein Plhal304r1_c008g0032981 [Plasmopara halstedii]
MRFVWRQGLTEHHWISHSICFSLIKSLEHYRVKLGLLPPKFPLLRCILNLHPEDIFSIDKRFQRDLALSSAQITSASVSVVQPTSRSLK